MLTNALLSFSLIPFFNGPLRAIPTKSLRWVLLGSVGMALQALLLNNTLAVSGQVVAINILYSARGLFSVLIGIGIGLLLTTRLERVSPLVGSLRLVGALLVSLAIVIVLRG